MNNVKTNRVMNLAVVWFVQNTTPGYPTNTRALQNYLLDTIGG